MGTHQLVHVVEACVSTRAMIASVLEAAGLRVRQYADPGLLLDECVHLQAGCVLADVRLPRVDGIELMNRLHAAGARLPVVMMSGHGDVATAVRAMKLGAADIIEKPLEAEVLLDTVRAALRAGPGAPSAGNEGAGAALIARLTARERQVLDHILTGRKHREIGLALGISPRTVEVFRSRVMAKMECDTIQDLMRAAMAAGCAGEDGGRRLIRVPPYGPDHTG